MIKTVLTWNKDKVLTKQKDQKENTPLHIAVSVAQRPSTGILFYRFTWVWRVPICSLLLKADSSRAYEPDSEGLFPVHIAAMTNRVDALDILLRNCPSCIGLRDTQGRTFLHVAAQNNGFHVVKYVCGRSEFASIFNIQDKKGNTALHLAVDVQNLVMVCALLSNGYVSLNLRNVKGQTALDLASIRIRAGFFFAGNPGNVIYNMLISIGAKHGSYPWHHLKKKGIPQPKLEQDTAGKQEAEEQEKKESDKLTSSTQTLGIGAVLIATVTFGASFAVPGGFRADDHVNGGTPTLAGSWYFDAFMVANTLAFICSSVATVGLMYSGMARVTLNFRRIHFKLSLFFGVSSLTSLTAAFALGVYMVLAPVARSTAIAICAISPIVLFYRNAQRLLQLGLVLHPILFRRGFFYAMMYAARAVLFKALLEMWPFAVIFGWAGHLRNHRHG